ncbi:MAG: hypothetical protein GW906_03135 [Epsilonproteobacteria bacterium]|nr:hypothetical protein [Campylobacterota bacterium]OIO15271.1 MAG: hypothetical protein AUJ81_07560 [Helicobacteraceae bacterium CG1_02_36_14]PIP10266.1 MAG: hypothetical protein COX50_07270 [Sulfurimonas sp. CG23_combo_of_CG06-09_8_20_14_all_36_33]PIS26415.1 MAG: hypothetical protein COT46_02190 [Sulfurimonas sp. CG08_land_8_20_14_0_20_36_33]PIU33877.1 MAG: hypothetical protein COT05_09595 [Sulfurimonas sp. CG07_land_8_20_14_0_80_36_56]PIV03705.1 MAG: hypothetical protein COS56_06820 [Sulfur
MEFFLKYKTVIFRTVGSLMLLIGFVTYFWATPKEGYSESDVAAANVARMEASISGGSSTKSEAKQSSSKFLDELKNTREKQIRYLTIMAMLFGIAFLIYSFVKKDE